MKRPSRPSIPIPRQVAALFRDKWLCRYCGRPVIFAPALKYLGQFVKSQGFDKSLAYYDMRYSRYASPLLEDLGLAIDHVDAFVKGGSNDLDNLVTACSPCNAQKSAGTSKDHLRRHPRRLIRSKHGEPTRWDGLASYFIVVGRANPKALTAQELKWFTALEGYLKEHAIDE